MKVALVTGSSEGIGFGIIENLLRNNYHCILVSRNIKKVNKSVDNLKNKGLTNVYGLNCNVSIKEERNKLFNFIKNKFGRLDCLILNAATNTHFGNILEINEKQFDKIYDLNLKSVFFMIKEYLPLMEVDSERKNIVIISSYVAFEFNILIGIYSMFKTALTPLIKMLSKALREKNIRVNGIAPGLIKTKFSKALVANEETTLEMMEIDRVGSVEDIAYAVEFLVSKKSDYINGSVIPVVGKPVIGL